MTNTTSTQTAVLPTTSEAIDFYLAQHGYASVDDAREDNVFHLCYGCGSIQTCTPAEGQTREEQVAILREHLDLTCCEDADDTYF